MNFARRPTDTGGGAPVENRRPSVEKPALCHGIRRSRRHKWMSHRERMPAHRIGRGWEATRSERDRDRWLTARGVGGDRRLGNCVYERI